jgi:hypothetical protein
MYENSLHVNPIIRNFWRNLKKNDSAFHVFKRNRNLVFFGDALSRSSFDYICDRLAKLGVKYDLMQICQAFMNLSNLENGHTDRLKELAIKAVNEALDIPEDLLEANLNEDAEVELNNSTKQKNYDYDSLSQEIKDQINKRILLNCVIQGASVHSFYTLHHVVKNELDTVHPSLVPLYDTFAAGSARSYYSVDYSSMVGNDSMASAGAMGSVKVEYEDDKPKVVANAKSFPVLCQELVKGAMETICLHGLQDISKSDLDKIYYFADARQDEPRYIQIGTTIWRNILELNKVLRAENNVTLPELVMNISMMSPNVIEDFFEKLNEGDTQEAAKFYLDNVEERDQSDD